METPIFEPDELYQLIKKRRKELKLSLRELADFTGLTIDGINRIENGRTDARLSNVLRIAQLLGIRIIAKTAPKVE